MRRNANARFGKKDYSFASSWLRQARTIASKRLQNNSNLVNVGLTATATDTNQGPVTIQVTVFGDEDDETPTAPNVVNSPDAKDLAPGTLRLRSERVDGGNGRVYLTVVSAIDSTGNISRQCLSTAVPLSLSLQNLLAVRAQAAAARSFCQANDGAPPQGYFVIGDGPVIGPNQ